ncbi:MAG: hypothetical protein ACRERZ_02770, partial [Gammaproteobacteria bacterium]
HRTRVVFLLLLVAAALLLPVWSVRFPPLLDYPNHLASSFVLGHLHDPAYSFNRLYGAHWGLYPYIATDFLMKILGAVFSMPTAGKLVLSLGVLGIPAAAWFFLRQANPGEDALAVWGLLAAYNIFFFYGFIGFYCSIALLFFALGLWLRWLAQPGAWRWTAACLALTATYFAHFMSFAFAALIMGFYSVTRPKLREWLGTAALFLPGALCYLLSSRAASRQSGIVFRSADDKFWSFWNIAHGYSQRLDWIIVAAVGVLLAAGWIWNSEFRWNGRWVVVSAGMLLTYIALPVGFGDGWDIDIRVLPVLFLLLFAMLRLGRRGWWFAAAALLLFAARTEGITQHFRRLQPELAGMARAFSLTPSNVRVLPIVAGIDEDPIEQFYPHFWAYGVIDRGWLSPYLLELPGLLPLHETGDVYEPDGFWDLSYPAPPDWKEVSNGYDYVWAYDVEKFRAGLSSIADPVYTSGKLTLYRVRRMADAPMPPPLRPGTPLP